MFDKEWFKTILYFIVMLLCVYLLIHYVGQRTVVDGGSMETTLYDGDNLILDKISYRFSDPKRYDIVVFPGEDDFYIKRVIGLPGETVDIIDGKVWIDGEELASDTFGKEPIEYPGLIEMPVTLGEDEYFCMGERGDQYRMMGWPNVITTKYLVDPAKEYNMLELHFAFTDTGVNSYRSEKDITIVAEDDAVLNSLIGAINSAAGLSIPTL